MRPKPTLITLSILVAVLLVWVQGEDQPQAAARVDESKKESGSELNPLEKKFKETLTNAVFVGKWRLVEKGQLGDESDDKYTIAGATKYGDDQWVLAAKIEYGGKSVTFPVPVKVLWAGDTPVISITNVGIPGLGTFTARVLVYDSYYTGTWSGSGHAGFLSGTVSRATLSDEKKKPEAK